MASDENDVENVAVETDKRKTKRITAKYSINKLKKELTSHPEILLYILKLKECLLKRKRALRKLKSKLDKITICKPTQEVSSQTDELCNVPREDKTDSKVEKITDWKLDTNVNNELESSGAGLSIAEQVKEAAESALQETGMVYEATSGMYYDYNTGYYYNAELGLYYHGTTGCYYYFDKEQNQFVFHSQPDTTSQHPQQASARRSNKKEKKKLKKEKRRKRGKKRSSPQEDDESDTNLERETKKSKKTKKSDSKDDSKSKDVKIVVVVDSNISKCDNITKHSNDSSDDVPLALEDGECSATGSEEDSSKSCDSESDESVASQYPPCMRIIVQETPISKLKVGSLFLLTKDGGTLGREGSTHSIVIPEENVSRHHLTFSYDDKEHIYMITDMGSRNGTLLNGKRMSAAQQESESMKIVHGSTIQLGGTRLLCHIHKGTATCGHCEPGLLIRDSPPPAVKSKEYKSVNLKKEHRKEIQRLKTKYKIIPTKSGEENVPQMPDGYEDKARKRREEVGSMHHGAKTEHASLETSIAADNKGFKMLQKMGWQAGDGLGKESKGSKDPVPLVANVGTLGLGCQASSADIAAVVDSGNKKTKMKANMWLATQKRFNMLPTPKAFADDEDSEEDS